MSTWTNISDTVLEPGKPIRSVDALALRDNPVAIAGGASGAPRITDAALSTTVTSAGTNWVLARTAGASVGAVGTYAFLGRVVTAATAEGTTVAGSGLRFGGVRHNDGTWNNNTQSANALGSQTAPAGTWRCMGRCNISGAIGTVWLRIS
jgi:hypothetical protein